MTDFSSGRFTTRVSQWTAEVLADSWKSCFSFDFPADNFVSSICLCTFPYSWYHQIYKVHQSLWSPFLCQTWQWSWRPNSTSLASWWPGLSLMWIYTLVTFFFISTFHKRSSGTQDPAQDNILISNRNIISSQVPTFKGNIFKLETTNQLLLFSLWQKLDFKAEKGGGLFQGAGAE